MPYDASGIAALLTKSDLSLTGLAKRIGVSISTVSRWLSGANCPTAKVMGRIIDLGRKYGMEVEDFFCPEAKRNEIQGEDQGENLYDPFFEELYSHLYDDGQRPRLLTEQRKATEPIYKHDPIPAMMPEDDYFELCA